MNGHGTDDRSVDDLALDEAILRGAFDRTSLRASERQLADFGALAAQMGEAERVPAREPAGRPRSFARLWAVAAAVALMAAAGWYAADGVTAPEQSGEPSVATQMPSSAPAAAGARPQAVEQAQRQVVAAPKATLTVAGWDDAASQLADDIGALAMIDDDPLAALDGWGDGLLDLDVAGQ